MSQFEEIPASKMLYLCAQEELWELPLHFYVTKLQYIRMVTLLELPNLFICSRDPTSVFIALINV